MGYAASAFARIHLHASLAAKTPIFGLLNSAPNQGIVEMIACAGYDFIILDMEHLPHDEPLLKHCIGIAQSYQCAPLVRLPSPEPKLIGRVLDMGAHGIVIPQVENANQVRAVRDAMRFPPAGKRSITGGSVTGFGTLPLADYIAQANQELLLVPMIETPEGVRAIADILAVEGVSMVLEGALDLALSAGAGPTPLCPTVCQQICHVAQQCQIAGVPFCANPRTEEQLQSWQRKHIHAWLCGEDRGFLFRALRQRLGDIKTSSMSYSGLS